MNSLLLESAVKLAALIRERSVTSREVVEAHIDRTERVNRILNAVVQDRYSEARREADAADAKTKASAPEELAPLHGVPCSTKECFALVGMPNTSGLVARKGFVVQEDATAVARLRAAGAIPIGVTNISELCMWMESNNHVYGRTNNPYDPSRIVGGSSGGEGAIVGAGGTPFGLGSDIGGSIRMPAFFNGVFGHKPTGGLVPGTGQYPVAADNAGRYLTTGPIARRAEDLWPLLQILAGPDGKDSACTPMQMGDPQSVKINELTIYDIANDGKKPVHPDLRTAQLQVAASLGQEGAHVVSYAPSALTNALEIWSSSLSAAGGPSFAELLGEGKPISAFAHLLRWPLGRTPHTLPAIMLALTEKLPDLLPARARAAVEQGRALRSELIDRIGDKGVILYPSYQEPAPRHNKPMFPPFNWVYTAIFNVMEFPVTQVPLGLNKDGVPVGVQVVAAPGNDHLTIAVARYLETRFGGWVPPERMDDV